MLVVTVYNIKMPLGFLPSEFKIMSLKLLIRSYNYRAKEKPNHNLHSWNLSSATARCINWDSPQRRVCAFKGSVHHLFPLTDNQGAAERAGLPPFPVLQPVPAGTCLHAVRLVRRAVPEVSRVRWRDLDPGDLLAKSLRGKIHVSGIHLHVISDTRHPGDHTNVLGGVWGEGQPAHHPLETLSWQSPPGPAVPSMRPAVWPSLFWHCIRSLKGWVSLWGKYIGRGALRCPVGEHEKQTEEFPCSFHFLFLCTYGKWSACSPSQRMWQLEGSKPAASPWQRGQPEAALRGLLWGAYRDNAVQMSTEPCWLAPVFI